MKHSPKLKLFQFCFHRHYPNWKLHLRRNKHLDKARLRWHRIWKSQSIMVHVQHSRWQIVSSVQIECCQSQQTGEIVWSRNASGNEDRQQWQMGTNERQSNLCGRCHLKSRKLKEDFSWDLFFSLFFAQSDEDNFTLSFYHKPMGNTSVPIYYAFTFPFTYTECQNQLDNFQSMHGKTEKELDSIVDRLVQAESKKEETTTTSQIVQEMDNLIQSLHPDRIDESNQRENKLAKMSPHDIYNQIYFHRELLIKSVEGRNVDLLTITSFHGIQSKTEDRLANLFPDLNTRRSHVFKDKKVSHCLSM